MNLYEIEQSEENPVYRQVAASNNQRHHDFLLSMIQSAIDSGKPWLSESLIKAINFHAIVGLHREAGQYRSVEVAVGNFDPPRSYRVSGLMEDFVNEVNWEWQNAPPVELAARALWRLNYIHTFVNGNGRTARAVRYYILCVKIGGPLPGEIILPARLRARRPQYVEALRSADEGDASPLVALIIQCLEEQLSSASPPTPSP